MGRDKYKRSRKKITMEEDNLNSKFVKLSIDEARISNSPIAINEYYYSLALNEAEANVERVKSAPKDIRLVKESPKKKKKKEDRIVETIESCSGKFKNLKITVQNDLHKVKEKSASPSKKTKEKNKETNMFEQLKMLQAGKITVNAIMSSKNSPLKISKNTENEVTAEEKLETLVKSVGNSPIANVKREIKAMSRNEKRMEIEALNKIIQDKISRAMPRFDSILDNKKEKNIDLPKLKIYSTDIKNFVTSKIKIGEKEIYRYSKDEMYYLQQFGTWKLVPRLLKLNICKTQLSTMDEFLLRLLEASNQERNELILNKAQERNFILRKGFSDFTFLSPNFSTTQKLTTMSSSNNSVKVNEQKTIDIPDFVERYRLIAKNNEELNELIYHHEFKILFENSFKDQNLRNMIFDDQVKYLVDTNQGYVVEGEIRVNQRNYQEAYVSLPNGMKDVCVSKLILRKHAFHGDFVRVLVKKVNDSSTFNSDQQVLEVQSPDIIDNELIGEISLENRNFGCVLEIIEKRHSRRVLGSFTNFSNAKKNRKNLTFISRDTRIPSNVRVNSRTGIPTDIELTEKLLIAVEIFEWNYDQPHGKVVSILGSKGHLKTENIAILLQNNLDPSPFDNNILNQLPNEPFEIPAKEFEYREDLRSKCIFSIDPETARDLDDALSCEVLPNGNLEVGVHISDVSYFVKEDSDLDKIVREKATTIYLVDTVYHMLPEKLCLMCSLLPGADKMAYSVFFEMNPNTAEIYETRYTRSIVNSSAKLSYDHAQMVIDRKDRNWSSLESEFPEIHNGFTMTDIAEVIVKLQKLAIILRANRKVNGALKIDQPKISFKFSKDDNRMETPVDFFKYPIKDSNRLIEEFMLLANISVATFINQNFPEVSLLRHHEPPNESAMKKLAKLLDKYGVQLDTSSSAALSKSMENLIVFAKHPNGMNAAINLVVSKTMSRAKYFCSSFGSQESDFWHYALSIPIYTHFTSPIRRYADILVHRTLNAALGYEKLTIKSPDEIQQLATICNTQKYNAKLAGDDSSNLYFMHFVQSLKSKTMMAAVLGIYDFNLEVVLVETGHVIKIYYKNLQQSDNVIIKIIDHSPPYVNIHLPDTQASMKIEFGMEILVQVEVLKDKLIINKIFYNS